MTWWHYLVALLLTGGIALFIGVAVKGFSIVGTEPGRATEFLSIDVAFFGLFFTVAWRLFTIGIYVGRMGLRYRGPVRTIIVPWSDVRGVRLAPFGLRKAFNMPIEAVTIWIDRLQGDSIQTYFNNQGADYLGRRKAFDAAYAAIARSVVEHLDRPEP